MSKLGKISNFQEKKRKGILTAYVNDSRIILNPETNELGAHGI